MYYIGIDLGGTNVAAGMVDGEGRLLAKASVPCPRGAEPIADAIAQAARLAAEKAGVEDLVSFRVADATRFAPSEPAGRVVTNPPYGERIMEKREAEGLYAAFGKAWRKAPAGWSLYLLSSHTEFERTFGKRADKKRKLYNGPLKCDLFQYLGGEGRSR